MFSFIANLFERDSVGNTDGVFSIPNRRNFDCRFRGEEGSKDPRAERLRGDPFVPEASYFSIRIVEMRMAEAGNYVSTYLPMCSCFLRYRYGTDEREVPFIVGYDTIRGLLGKCNTSKGAGNIAFTNAYVVRDVPVKAGGLTMYAALCRVSDSTFARGMLDLIGDTVAAIGGPAVGLVASTGINMTKRLGALLGSDGVTTRFGLYDGDALVESGYRVLAGAGLDAARFEMKDGQLRRTNAHGELTPVDDVDYLVVAFEHRKTLLDQPFGTLAHLPFHAKWTELAKKLVKGETASAEDDFRLLKAEIVASPDLVEADRLGLVTTYVAQFEAWRNGQAGIPTVRAGGESLSADLSDRADSLGSDRETVALLLRTASKHVSVFGDEWPDPAQALSDDAVFSKMQRINSDIQSAQADPGSLGTTTTQLLAATYGT
ncbi:hypothetical protein [Burkholderia stagnalis]|uniref:hypothetical protein n=1 Tax=Burkholderia stagnalis TaxID=1503054 RepID=UPI00075BFB42|nr:hypothetical protein [Burkholderia stagnalis]KVL96221.1 hypothetical protein WT03_10760 [Burkholderia stagnalis]KVL96547.1 hypothetical protein WT02_15930 [Burkholderia stagnalis]KVM13416.1 hypothetical protein WT04_10150 [Burkholderia stagnalis]